MQLCQIVFAVLEIGVQLRNVLQIFFNLQFLRNPVRTEGDGIIRIVFHRLSIAVDRLFDPCRVRHFQRVVQALQVGIMDICQTDPIQLQLLLNRFGSQDQLIANVLHGLLLDDAGDVLNVTIQHFLRVLCRWGSEA